jgi:uncharacterized protein YkwD
VRRVLAAVLLAASTLLASMTASLALAATVPLNHAQFVTRLVDLVNAERQRANLPALTANGALSRSAQGYAIVLADGTCFAHDCGSQLVQRALGAGYNNWLNLGENIAAGHLTPEAVMAAWMGSPGHRSNILSGNYRDIGIGLAASSNGTLMWVQDFGRSQTASSTPPAPNCSPRPTFSVRTVNTSTGTLQVTVTAGRTTGAPNNAVHTVKLGALLNATIDVPGYGGAASDTAVGIAPGTQQVTFVVRRAGGSTGTTTPLVLTDDCGEWRTFVGGGRSAF